MNTKEGSSIQLLNRMTKESGKNIVKGDRHFWSPTAKQNQTVTMVASINTPSPINLEPKKTIRHPKTNKQITGM